MTLELGSSVNVLRAVGKGEDWQGETYMPNGDKQLGGGRKSLHFKGGRDEDEDCLWPFPQLLY